MNSEIWFWIGVFGMALGAAAILLTGKQRTGAEQAHTILSGLVPIIAAFSYFAMVTGEGSVVIHLTDGSDAAKNIYFARYVDWAFTTPILLTGLALTAMHGLKKRWGVIFGLIGSDILMILSALFFGITSDQWTRWMWYVISCGAFLGVYYGIWVQLRKINALAAPDVQKLFKGRAVFLSVIWFIYPVLLALGTDGLAILNPDVTTGSITILDLVAKVAFGVAGVAAMTKITARDLSENRAEAVA